MPLRRRHGRSRRRPRDGGPAIRRRGDNGGRADRAPQRLSRLERLLAHDGRPIRWSPTGGLYGRDGSLAKQAIDDIPQRGEARLQELEGFVACRCDTCVDVGLALDEKRFQVRLVNVGRALRCKRAKKKKKISKSAVLYSHFWHVPRIVEGRGKEGKAS